MHAFGAHVALEAAKLGLQVSASKQLVNLVISGLRPRILIPSGAHVSC